MSYDPRQHNSVLNMSFLQSSMSPTIFVVVLSMTQVRLPTYCSLEPMALITLLYLHDVSIEA